MKETTIKADEKKNVDKIGKTGRRNTRVSY